MGVLRPAGQRFGPADRTRGQRGGLRADAPGPSGTQAGSLCYGVGEATSAGPLRTFHSARRASRTRGRSSKSTAPPGCTSDTKGSWCTDACRSRTSPRVRTSERTAVSFRSWRKRPSPSCKGGRPPACARHRGRTSACSPVQHGRSRTSFDRRSHAPWPCAHRRGRNSASTSPSCRTWRRRPGACSRARGPCAVPGGWRATRSGWWCHTCRISRGWRIEPSPGPLRWRATHRPRATPPRELTILVSYSFSNRRLLGETLDRFALIVYDLQSRHISQINRGGAR